MKYLVFPPPRAMGPWDPHPVQVPSEIQWGGGICSGGSGVLGAGARTYDPLIAR